MALEAGKLGVETSSMWLQGRLTPGGVSTGQVRRAGPQGRQVMATVVEGLSIRWFDIHRICSLCKEVRSLLAL